LEKLSSPHLVLTNADGDKSLAISREIRKGSNGMLL
jgi:hypothetical protein